MDSKKSLVYTTAENIIKIIRDNHLKPGDKLFNEYELIELLGVGRSTVREAVKSLESRNILEIRRGAGTFISENEGVATDPLGISLIGRDEQTALELLEVRMILEPEVAALAAKYASPKEIAAIEKQNRKVINMIRQGIDHAEEDAKFHQMIAESAQNKILARLVPIIQHSIILAIKLTDKRLTETTIIYHTQIVEAIARKDERGARSSMIAHLSENRLCILKEIERKKQYKSQ